MFIKNYPAMKLGKYLVVADLHFGITKDIYDSGIRLPNQAKRMAEKINRLKKITKTESLVILGDLKHNIPNILIQEKKEISEFLSSVDFERIILIKGNHDGKIETIVGERCLVKKYMKISGYLLAHGHGNIKTGSKKIIIGHNHPQIMFRDQLNAYYTEPVWLVGTSGKKEITIMPAFNELCGSTIVNRDALLGPIVRGLKKNQTHIYLLDGTYIGLNSDMVVIDAV
jgi:putative SbcD/Mre11-related phosphoesterase